MFSYFISEILHNIVIIQDQQKKALKIPKRCGERERRKKLNSNCLMSIVKNSVKYKMNRKNQPSVKRFIVCFFCFCFVSIRLKRILLKIFPKNSERRPETAQARVEVSRQCFSFLFSFRNLAKSEYM